MNSIGERIKERPIIFSSDMVRAILAGRKTMTRRVIKPQPYGLPPKVLHWRDHEKVTMDFLAARCDYGEPLDRLWVREKFRLVDFEYVDDNWNASVQYGADMELGPRLHNLDDDSGIKTGWRPSIHMPRAASRIMLEITDVRAEQVQDITEEDILREGVKIYEEDDPRVILSNSLAFSHLQPRNQFICLWDALYAKKGYGWDINPYVWTITFRRIK